jgi:hypothetical protein
MNQYSSPTIPPKIPVVFTPYQYNRSTEFKPINFQMFTYEMTPNHSNSSKDSIKKTVPTTKLTSNKGDVNELINKAQSESTNKEICSQSATEGSRSGHSEFELNTPKK